MRTGTGSGLGPGWRWTQGRSGDGGEHGEGGGVGRDRQELAEALEPWKQQRAVCGESAVLSQGRSRKREVTMATRVLEHPEAAGLRVQTAF